MFAVGHIALGYLTGKTASKLLRVEINIPLLFLASVLPDIDLVLGLEHRGPTHSIIVYAIAFLPIFLVYGKRCLPILVALTQHSLIGDMLTGGGVQILWPVTSQWYGLQICMASDLSVSMEWAAFLLFLILFWKTNDARSLLKGNKLNLLLTIPVFAIVLPAFLGFPMAVPVALIVPHLILLAILAIPIITGVKRILRKP